MEFGEHHLTANFHDLDHMVEICERTGRLHEFSGFSFESLNGYLKSLCKGNIFNLKIFF